MGVSLTRICGREPITSYVAGGFKFGTYTRQGSALVLPTGIFEWDATDVSAINPEPLAVMLKVEHCEFFLLGAGPRQVFASAELSAAFSAAGIGLDMMTTGAACRTANVLMAEQRHFAVGLIAL